MKAVISGPRFLPRRDDPKAPWPHMHVELDLPGIPAAGEHITLNGGCTYTVKRRFWYVGGPETGKYYAIDADYDTDQGVFDVVYLDVLPSDYDEPFTPDKMHTEGTEHGREQAAAEVENLLGLTSAPGVDPASALAMLREWCREGAARKRERDAESARRVELTRQILDELQAERERESEKS
jgi:hypothetical protein